MTPDEARKHTAGYQLDQLRRAWYELLAASLHAGNALLRRLLP